ncbi:hypothetical protein Esti_006190 [Eimeria stiedai]
MDSSAPTLRLPALCLLCGSLFLLLSLGCLLVVEASEFHPPSLEVSSSPSTSSSSSSRSDRVHQVVVSKVQEVVNGARVARLELSLQAPPEPAAEGQRGSASGSSNLIKGFLTATLRGSQFEVFPPLFDGDPRSLATLLDVALKEAESLGAGTVLSIQESASNAGALLGHAYAGFSPVAAGGRQQASSKVVWRADASRRRRHQLRQKTRGLQIVPLARATEAQKKQLEQFCRNHGNTTIDEVLSSVPPPVCIFAMDHHGDILQALVPLSVKKRASSSGISLEIVGPRGRAVGSELLARLIDTAEASELAGVVLPVRASDASRIHEAVDAGLSPISFDGETINFSPKRTELERVFPYTTSNEGESSDEEAEVVSEAQREKGAEWLSRAPTEVRQRVQDRWGRLIAQLKARGLIGELKETPHDAAGADAAVGAKSVSLKGVGMGVATAVLLALLVLGMVPRRRGRTRTAAGNVGLSFMPHEVEVGSQAFYGHGGDVKFGVEATAAAPGSQKPC